MAEWAPRLPSSGHANSRANGVRNDNGSRKSPWNRMNEGAKTMGRAGSPRSSFAAKRSTALQSAAGRLPTGLHKRDQALARQRRIRARRVSLPPRSRTPESGGCCPVGTILDTARARRAPSRSSGVRAAFVRHSTLGKRLGRGFMSPTLNLPESGHGAELNAHDRIGLVSGEGRSTRRGRAPGER